MNLPTFNAERSLGRTTRRYRCLTVHRHPASGTLSPQQLEDPDPFAEESEEAAEAGFEQWEDEEL